MAKITPLSLEEEARQLLIQLAQKEGVKITEWVRRRIYEHAKEGK